MGAKMYDGKLAIRAGMKEIVKYVNESTAVVMPYSFKREEFLRAFRIMDEQDAINRYHWYNIPAEISSQDIERMLYYKGQVCAFYFKKLNKFYFMPYALAGSIDFYGRYNTVHPIPFAQGTEGAADEREREKDPNYKNQKELLSRIFLKCYYDVVMEEDVDKIEFSEEQEASDRGQKIIYKAPTVLLHDYCKQRAENVIPRSVVNDSILNEMADTIAYLDVSLLAGSGVKGYRVANETAKTEVDRMAQAIYKNAINRTPYVAISSPIDMQELGLGGDYKVNDYLMAFQGLDNLRLSTYGISNGGVYEKQAHILESEMEINNSSVYSPLEDGLKIRQRFCNIFNSIFGTSLWCEPSEAALKTDLNGDGVSYDREVDEKQQGEAPEQEGGQE